VFFVRVETVGHKTSIYRARRGRDLGRIIGDNVASCKVLQEQSNTRTTPNEPFLSAVPNATYGIHLDLRMF
jgi:hypothetical protein